MKGWENNVFQYMKDRTIAPCPYCHSNDIRVEEMLDNSGTRMSVTLKCNKCNRQEHFDGFAKENG